MRLILLLAAVSSIASAQSSYEHLPPVAPFEGASRALLLPADAEWVTPFEASGGLDSPDYAETMAWFAELVEASPLLQRISIGRSAEGREIWMILASQEGAADREAMWRNGRPTVLAHAGIHSGEIDGKDAGMMLLRDLTVGKRLDLLERVNFLFVPILNVDGHERRSEFSRINQRGPTVQGWRTNRRNLNLNRDFSKLDTPAVRALVQVLDQWQPELYLDLHVTDGVDYQYDVTYGYNGPHAWSPAIATWLDEKLRPQVDRRVSGGGHVPGPLVFSVNGGDMSGGNYEWTAPPRFSTGYGDARHQPAVLLENLSLKPFDQRVLGTYLFLQGCLEAVAADAEALRAAIESDRTLRRDTLPLSFTVARQDFEQVDFLAIASRREISDLTGAEVVRWLGTPETQRIPVVVADGVQIEAARPARYYIPAAWADIAERLAWHGIRMERVEETRTVAAQMLRLPEARFDDQNENPFEGHARVSCGRVEIEQRDLILRPGSYVVPTDQPLGTLAMLLLEPQAPDSFFQWGYLLECLQRTEYFEEYAVEPMARRMLADDAGLRAEFEAKLAADSSFAATPRDRLGFFYERMPYYDQEYRLYPIGRGMD